MKLSNRIHSKPDLSQKKHRKAFCNSHSPPEHSDGEAFQWNRPVGKIQSFLEFIAKLRQRAMATLFPDLPEAADLKIEKEQDRHGNTHWHARDPWTGKSVFFVSESEVLCWIDSLYRQSH